MMRHKEGQQRSQVRTRPSRGFDKGLVALAVVVALSVISLDARQAFAQADAPMQVDEQTVDRFAEAILAIRQMESGFMQDLNEAQTATDEQRVRQEWNAAARDELANHDLSIDKYNQLVAMAQADPDFAAEVQERIESLQ